LKITVGEIGFPTVKRGTLSDEISCNVDLSVHIICKFRWYREVTFVLLLDEGFFYFKISYRKETTICKLLAHNY
jgi:hypothetical protein